MICQAAAAGLHIVVEKPLAVDLPSALEAAKAIAAAGVTLSVCFPYRYEAASLAALDLVKAGAIGPVKGAALTFHVDKPQAYWEGGFSGRSTSNWRSSASRAGGGVLIMNMTHFIDMLRQLAGQEIISVQAFTQRAAVAEVEDSIAVAARFENGAIATLLGSASTRGSPDPRLELWGEHGTLELGSHPRIYSERAIPGLLTGRWNQLPVGESDERRLFVEQFCATLLDGVPPQVTLKDGLAVQAIVDAIYRSAASGVPERVWRPEDRQ
jgi:predicted dehydrogenase